MSRRTFTESTWRNHPWFKALCKTLTACQTEREMANLLRDVGTLSELQSWSERWAIARLLVRGMTYQEISHATGASTTTITRVAHFVADGEGGYRRAFVTVPRGGSR